MFTWFLQKMKYRGVTAIEVAIGVSIAALVIVYAMTTIGLFVNAGRTTSEKTKALYLVEDGFELLRYVRDGSWPTLSALSSNTTYYLSVTTAGVYVVTTPQTIDGFTRSFRISNVYRNSSDDIVASTTGGSSADTSSKYITMTVTGGVSTTTVSMVTILTEIDP
jgi:hypothetical protein